MRLTVILSERVIDERNFAGGRTVRIGRNEHSDIRLDNLGVSRVHCELEDSGGGVWSISDRSGGRTLLNDVQISRHGLDEGDRIQAGKFTIVVSLAGARGKFGAAAPRPKPERPLGHLVEGEAKTELTTLHTRLGSGAACELKLKGWRQPRISVVIVREETGYHAVDVSPKADSLKVGGKQVQRAALAEGAEVEVRGRSFVFRLGGVACGEAQ